MKMTKGVAAALLVAVAQGAHADVADELEGLVGYTIAAAVTVTGWRDANGKKGDSFEGCDHGRAIIFDDSKALTCATYSYTYSYRPKAIVFVRGSSFKMLVDDDLYDMRR